MERPKVVGVHLVVLSSWREWPGRELSIRERLKNVEIMEGGREGMSDFWMLSGGFELWLFHDKYLYIVCWAGDLKYLEENKILYSCT